MSLPRPLRWPPVFPLSRGLVLWIPFDDRSGGKAQDRSGKRNHATLFGPTWGASLRGSCINLKGDPDYATVTHSPSLVFTSELSIFLRVNCLDLSTFELKLLIKYANVSPWSGFGVMSPGGVHAGQLSLWVGGSAWTYNNKALDDGSWHSWGASYKGGLVSLYTDGKLTNSATQTANFTSIIDLYIGRDSAEQHWFPGSLKDLLLFSRGLSASEHKRLHESEIMFLRS